MSPLGSLSSSVLPTCIVSSRVFVNAWDGPSPVSMVRKVSLEEPENVQLEVQDRGGRGGLLDRRHPRRRPASFAAKSARHFDSSTLRCRGILLSAFLSPSPLT